MSWYKSPFLSWECMVQDLMINASGQIQTAFFVYQLKVGCVVLSAWVFITVFLVVCMSPIEELPPTMGSACTHIQEYDAFAQGENTTEDLSGLSLVQLRLMMIAAKIIDSYLGTDKVGLQPGKSFLRPDVLQCV